MSASNPVPRLYRTVVDEVVKNVREAFLNEGVDEQVLLELKQLWESKLLQSRAIDFMPADASVRMNLTYPHSNALHVTEQNTVAQKVTAAPGQLVGANPEATPMIYVNLGQLTAPAAQAAMAIHGTAAADIRTQSASGSQPRHLQVGHTQQQPQLTQQQLYQQQIQQLQQQQKSMNAQNIQQLQQAKQVPQQQQHLQQSAGIQIIQGQPSTTIYAGFNQAAAGRGPRVIYTQPAQQNPAQRVAASKQIIQVDGAQDSSSDDDDDDNFDDLDQYPINVDSNDLDANQTEGDDGEEGDPLNTDDDISEEDSNDLFDTDNVVVCQFDKIARSKNKWKFYLKDGIMNLKSKDYVFHKANGESEW